MITLGELKKLHTKGLALIYLRPKSKRPFESGWTSQTKKSWEELENSFVKDYNIGVRLGEPSKLPTGMFLGALDCDVKSKSRKAMLEMNEQLRALGVNLDAAPIVMSGRGNGSKHIYVQTKSPMKPMRYAQSTHRVKVLMPSEKGKPHSAKEVKELTPEEKEQGYRIRPAWEISFMGTGQQTVLPPSVHPDTGMKYAWASPLTVKHAPVFEPSKFVKVQAEATDGEENEPTSKFKAEEVDLYETKLPIYWINTIEEGVPRGGRSDVIFSAAMAMCRAQFTDNQILSVLSDPNHGLSEAALERRGGNRQSAVQWLRASTLKKARHETNIMRRFENKPVLERLSEKETEKVNAQIVSDRNSVLPDVDGKGKPQSTLRNVLHVLTHFLGDNLVGYDEFSNRATFLKDTPYGGKKGRELTDNDDLQLMHYLACHYRFEPSADYCYKAHALMAQKNKFHPVREYLKSLEWDGVDRLDDWMRTAFKAVGPEDYITAISRKVLVAAVKRVFEPGCKYDYVTVLEGHQGKGKSTALSILAGPAWFTDNLGDILQKDVVDQMTGKWIVEMGELAAIRKAEIEPVKAFVSRQVDRVRPPYGRRSMDFPRQGIFMGSTNNSEYFSDETGNRRFWPVKIQSVNRKWLRENRDQLWAEALLFYEQGEKIYLSKELEEVAKREQEKRFEVDEWESEIKAIIQKNGKEETFTTTGLWRAIHLTDAGGHPNMVDSKRIAKIMKRLKFRRSKHTVDGVQGKCWRREYRVKSNM